VICKTLTLDSLLRAGEIEAPDFVKIDVEGAEPLVFRGAQQMFNRTEAPLILFEQWSEAAERLGFRRTEAADLLLSLGQAQYELFDASGGRLRPLATNNVEKGNLLAVPAARRRKFYSVFKDQVAIDRDD
jgi:Methyltransferase FkbM domain